MLKHQINISSFQISYRVVNPHQRPKIFFIHGNSNSSNLWQYQLRNPLFDEYQLIAIDLPGHGDSSHACDPRAEYSVIALANVLQKIVSKLSDNSVYILCGFSLGTNVITEMLALNDAATGLVLVSPSMVGSDIVPQRLNEHPIAGQALFSANVSEETLGNYLEFAFLPENRYEKELFKGEFRHTDPAFRQGLMDSASEGVFSDEIRLLNNSNIPTLIITGSRDRVVNTDLFHRPGLFRENIRLRILTGGGHYLPLEQPDDIAMAIVDFSAQLL